MKTICDDINIFTYRDQGVFVVSIHGISSKKTVDVECNGISIHLKSKNGIFANDIIVRRTIPKKERLKINIEDVLPMKIKCDTKKYKGEIIAEPKHFFNQRAAERDRGRYQKYENTCLTKESKKQIDKAAHSKEKYTNYTNSNISSPYSGGLVSPK